MILTLVKKSVSYIVWGLCRDPVMTLAQQLLAHGGSGSTCSVCSWFPRLLRLSEHLRFVTTGPYVLALARRQPGT